MDTLTVKSLLGLTVPHGEEMWRGGRQVVWKEMHEVDTRQRQLVPRQPRGGISFHHWRHMTKKLHPVLSSGRNSCQITLLHTHPSIRGKIFWVFGYLSVTIAQQFIPSNNTFLDTGLPGVYFSSWNHYSKLEFNSIKLEVLISNSCLDFSRTTNSMKSLCGVL